MTGVRLRVAPALLLAIGCSGGGQSGLADLTGPRSNASAGSTAVGMEADAGEASGGAPEPILMGTSQSPAELGGAPSDGLEVVEVGAGETMALEATPRVFIPPTSSFFVFDRAGVVGERRFALDSASLALLTFAPDGSGASDVVRDEPLMATAQGDRLQVLELETSSELVSVSFDDQLSQASDKLRLGGDGTSSHALAASADEMLAIWSKASVLRGQLFGVAGPIGDGFDFGPQSCAGHGCVASALWNGERFAVLWSRVNADGHTLLSWGTIDAYGEAFVARNILGSEAAFRLVDATPLEGRRTAVLLTLGTPAKSPLLLFVDRFGNLEKTLHVYPGATEAWSLASNGKSLLLAARSARSQGVVRELDLYGEPLTGWLVVDDSGPDTGFEPRVALFPVDASYEAVVRMTDGSSAISSIPPAFSLAP